MDKAETFYRCAPILRTIHYNAFYIWEVVPFCSFHDLRFRLGQPLNELASALREMPDLGTDVFARLASLVGEAQSSEFTDLETWFDNFDDSLDDYYKFVDETAAQLFGVWGAAFFLIYVEEKTLEEADRFSRMYNGRLILRRFSRRRRFNVKHIVWFCQKADGKLSYQQVADRYNDQCIDAISRDAIVKAIKRLELKL